MKIIAVDFDGVISDSALKSLFVSHKKKCKNNIKKKWIITTT